MLLLTILVYSAVKWCSGRVDNPSGQISYWGHRNVRNLGCFHGFWNVGYVQKNPLSASMPITPHGQCKVAYYLVMDADTSFNGVRCIHECHLLSIFSYHEHMSTSIPLYSKSAHILKRCPKRPRKLSFSVTASVMRKGFRKNCQWANLPTYPIIQPHISPFQHGFVPNLSCDTNLASFLSHGCTMVPERELARHNGIPPFIVLL